MPSNSGDSDTHEWWTGSRSQNLGWNMVFQGRGDHPEVEEMDSILTLTFLNMYSQRLVNDQVEIPRLSCNSHHVLFFQATMAAVKGFRTNI